MRVLPRKQPLDSDSAGEVDSTTLLYTHVNPPLPDPEWMQDAKQDVAWGLQDVARQHQQWMEFRDGRLRVRRG